MRQSSSPEKDQKAYLPSAPIPIARGLDPLTTGTLKANSPLSAAFGASAGAVAGVPAAKTVVEIATPAIARKNFVM